MDGAVVVESGAMVAAGALVTPGKRCEARGAVGRQPGQGFMRICSSGSGAVKYFRLLGAALCLGAGGDPTRKADPTTPTWFAPAGV
jgi:hypothetical protein